jgi:hypothetical protein
MGSDIDLVKLRSSLGLYSRVVGAEEGAEFRQQLAELLKILPKA